MIIIVIAANKLYATIARVVNAKLRYVAVTNLLKEIALFTDADGLVSPYNLERPGETSNASGNGVLYTGELMALLNRHGELNTVENILFRLAMLKCMPVERGLLHRSPTHPDQQGPDDYVGFFVGCHVTGNSDLVQSVIDYGWKHYGFFNNANPGSFYHKDGRFNSSAFLIRQVPLVGLAYSAAGKPKRFLNFITAIATATGCCENQLTVILTGLMSFIIFILSALTVNIMFLVSCVLFGLGCFFAYKESKPISDVDARFLGWLMLEGMPSTSWTIKQAKKLFDKRVLRDYPKGMNDVAAMAFGNRNPEHPFAKYWPAV